MSQSKHESGPQSPPPSYPTATPMDQHSLHLHCDKACTQCDHAALETDTLIKTGQSAYIDEKFNYQHELHSKEKEDSDLLKEKQEIGMEDGKWKWETKRGDMKRKWATKKEDVKRKWESTKDDIRSKWATKTTREKAHSYVPLNESKKPVKERHRKVQTRAELSGNRDAELMAGIVSIAMFVMLC
ncbi:hypothetical protein VE03_09417 [Pseudogymnoascus sp. 23342-1-I1]|nr:hypothetical protein VE03_09417 [Pseudogymnoascus sp. 23342-1-I1]